MSALYPTPTRLRLLRHALDGEVRRLEDDEVYDFGGGRRKVTAQVVEQVRAGWLHPRWLYHLNRDCRGHRVYRPTTDGRRILAEHPTPDGGAPCGSD